ncbi:MAG: hypothetical protein Q8862_12415 [Bacteroidota bacterium]|nr:hypothetical protein [Bacteroidota bacterium]MDP4206359.1 hypothetical protein [Bacteroidota bacterium]
MKEFLIEKKPRLSIVIAIVFFVVNILTQTIPMLSNFLVLYPHNLYEPQSWYRFLTYPLYVGGLLNWIHFSLVIILTGYIIENRTNEKLIYTILILSTVIGGLVCAIFNQNQPIDVSIGSPTIIAWGFWSAAVVAGIKLWHSLAKFERWILILCFVYTLNITIGNLGSFLSQISVILIIALYCLIRRKFSQK